VKPAPKKVEAEIDYEFDDMEFDDDIIEILDAKEEVVSQTVQSVLTEKNTVANDTVQKMKVAAPEHSRPVKNPSSPLKSQGLSSPLTKKEEKLTVISKPITPLKTIVVAKKSPKPGKVLDKSPEKVEEITVPSKRAMGDVVEEKKEPSAKQAR
jgi:hypothetical protein